VRNRVDNVLPDAKKARRVADASVAAAAVALAAIMPAKRAALQIFDVVEGVGATQDDF
jgi:hypothetical protein